ncbi:hypothetical protein K7432_008003 [Basidiobolus ranarum]|uniref:Uncharacterized protein n=1 Tax=Basidiobolus ranarum TaxID=34480 RepID=A0ABR2WSN6_9FUNG
MEDGFTECVEILEEFITSSDQLDTLVVKHGVDNSTAGVVLADALDPIFDLNEDWEKEEKEHSLHCGVTKKRGGTDIVSWWLRSDQLWTWLLKSGPKFSRVVPDQRAPATHLDESKSNVTGGSPNQNYDPVVPLQVTGSGVPIFFVHPGVGEVLIFVNLAKYFVNERPFYALRARGFDENQT